MSPRDWNVLQIFSVPLTSTPTVTPVSEVLTWPPPIRICKKGKAKKKKGTEKHQCQVA